MTPRRTDEEAAVIRKAVEDWLDEHGWQTAQQIRQGTGYTRDDMRGAGMLEDGSVIGHTTLGFRLTRCASTSEINHAINSLNSRASEIAARAHAIERAAT